MWFAIQLLQKSLRHMNKIKSKVELEPEPRAINGIIIAESEDWAGARFDVEGVAESVSQLFYDNCITNQLPDKGFEYSLLLTNDENIQQLNKDFRDKDAPTNVLSFPQYELSEGDLAPLSGEEGVVMLGDVALSWQTFDAECEQQGKDPENHFSHLLLHSLLHLIGYDHQNDRDAKRMMDLEINLLAKININNPYEN